MTDKQMDKLVHRKARLAWQMEQARALLDPAIEERYGTHPGEIDCDAAIDSLDYNGGDYSLAKLDADMASCGHPAKPHNKKAKR